MMRVMEPFAGKCDHLWAKASERTEEDDALVVTYKCRLCGMTAERTFRWEEDA